jgi:hypothetical protein
MIRNDHLCKGICTAQDDVTALLTLELKADLSQGFDAFTP